MKRFHEKNLLEHFPETLPDDAKLLKFYYCPAFFQRGDTLQIRLKYSEEKISELDKEFREKAYLVFDTAKEYYAAKYPKHYDTVRFWVSDNGDQFDKFTDDYAIMILDDILPDSKNSRWRSWDAHGVAISKKHNEIVYWAEWSN